MFFMKRALLAFKFEVNRIESLFNDTVKDVLSRLVKCNRFSILKKSPNKVIKEFCFPRMTVEICK